MRCVRLKPEDLDLVCAKAPSGYHKIIDRWEDIQYQVLSQLDDQPVFGVQPVDAVMDENIRVLHRNMLFPIQTVTEQDLIITNTESEDKDKKHVAL